MVFLGWMAHYCMITWTTSHRDIFGSQSAYLQIMHCSLCGGPGMLLFSFFLGLKSCFKWTMHIVMWAWDMACRYFYVAMYVVFMRSLPVYPCMYVCKIATITVSWCWPLSFAFFFLQKTITWTAIYLTNYLDPTRYHCVLMLASFLQQKILSKNITCTANKSSTFLSRLHAWFRMCWC